VNHCLAILKINRDSVALSKRRNCRHLRLLQWSVAIGKAATAVYPIELTIPKMVFAPLANCVVNNSMRIGETRQRRTVFVKIKSARRGFRLSTEVAIVMDMPFTLLSKR
jgi:hypothetical protein